MATYLTPRQLAERWERSVSHVNRLARTGQIAAMRSGKGWRFSLASIEAYEAAHTTEPAPMATARAERQTARTLGVATATTFGPAPENPVFPHLWGLPAAPAASPAARRSGSASKKKTASLG